MKSGMGRHMSRTAVVALAAFYCGSLCAAGSIAFGAAPEGDPKSVASRIMQANFDPKDCPKIVTAARLSQDRSIRIACSNGETFRISTIFDAKRGKMLEIAMRCSAAAKMGVTGC
jgi:hypothetical protein